MNKLEQEMQWKEIRNKNKLTEKLTTYLYIYYLVFRNY